MLKIDKALQSIVLGVHKANETYINWSGGYNLSDYGIESLISSEIARSIYDNITARQDVGYVTLETSFAQIWAACKPGVKGRKPAVIRPTLRADVVYWDRNSLPIGVVEVKRRFEYSASEKDIQRTRSLLGKLGPDSGGKLKWGCIASFRPVYPSNEKAPKDVLEEFISKCTEKFPDLKFSGDTKTEEVGELHNGTGLKAYQAYAVIFRQRKS